MSNFKISDGIVIGSNGIIFSDGSTQTTSTANASNITSGELDSTLLANTGVTAGTYGSSTQVPVIVIDDKGRITSASNTNISDSGYTVETITANTNVAVEDLSKLYLCNNSNHKFLTLPIATEAGVGWNFKVLIIGSGNVSIQVANSQINSILYDVVGAQSLTISQVETTLISEFANNTFEDDLPASTAQYSVTQKFKTFEVICISSNQFVVV